MGSPLCALYSIFLAIPVLLQFSFLFIIFIGHHVPMPILPPPPPTATTQAMPLPVKTPPTTQPALVPPPQRQLEVGMRLEAVDRRFPYYVCVATIEDKRGESKREREREINNNN